MKTITLLPFFIISVINLSAQVYLNLNYSHENPVFTEAFSDGTIETIDGKEVRKIVPYSLGNGNQYGLNIGFKITKGIYADLGLIFHKGNKTSRHFSGPNRHIDYDIIGNYVGLSPGFKILLEEDKLVSYYAKVGFLAGLKTEMFESSESLDNSALPIKYTYNRRFSESIPIGGEFAFGVEVNANRNLTFSLGFRMVMLEFTPRYSELIHFDVNGESQLPKLNTRDIKSEYITTNADLVPNNDPNLPAYKFVQSYPFHGFGFSFGVQYWFGKDNE